ncbi:TPA: Tn3 family transposase, partial [Pseudomonas aeruginosa]
MSRWAPGKKTPKSVGRAYVGFWFHCSPNPDYPTLRPMVGGTLNIKHVRAHWDDILRLASSIK